MKKINYAKVRDVKSPVRAHSTDAGIDFFIPEDFEETTLEWGDDVLIPSGIKFDVLTQHMLLNLNKSGVASKHGLIIGACVIDEPYQGEIHLNLIKATKGEVTLKPGDKILQSVLIPVDYSIPNEVPVSELFSEETERGEGWAGSTGTS